MQFLLVSLTLCFIFCANAEEVPSVKTHEESSWVFRLMLNMIGYATVIVPGYLIITYIKKAEFMKSKSNGYVKSIIKTLVIGEESDSSQVVNEDDESVSTGRFPNWVRLLWCVFGLLSSYLLWGYLQERIMTLSYDNEKFGNSLFLVFVNRILALCIGALYLYMRPSKQKNSAPFYLYSYSSFSNTLSSWCQYEALKFVSFPVQVLAKASKIIPVMLMGKLLNKKTYRAYEYITAALISTGVGVFMLASKEKSSKVSDVTTISGGILLCMYLTSDAFSSNWQGGLFSKYKMSSIHMMVGVNVFSVLFTGFSLLEQGGFLPSIDFMNNHPAFMKDVMMLSICSTTGQLFIFYTIAEFGPVTFTIIMTTRQALAILISCIIFMHPINSIGLIGILIVFGAIAIRMYCQHRIKQQKKKLLNLNNP